MMTGQDVRYLYCNFLTLYFIVFAIFDILRNNCIETIKENKKENPLNVPKTAQDSIPYRGVYENGIIQKIFTPKEIKTKIHAEQILDYINQ